MHVTGINKNAMRVRDRFLIAAFHNGWTCVTARALGNRVGLRQGIRNPETGDTVYEYSGSFEIDRVF
jgi:hypothetical protein